MNFARVELDFLAPPRERRALGLVVLASALLLAGFMVARFYEVKVSLQQIEISQGLNSNSRAVRSLPKEQLEEETKRVQATLRELAMPWGTIIETVEAAATPDVAVLQMQPDAQQRELRLSVEARTQDAMLEYLAHLASAKALAKVHLVSHQVVADDPQRPIQFTVQARLRGLP